VESSCQINEGFLLLRIPKYTFKSRLVFSFLKELGAIPDDLETLTNNHGYARETFDNIFMIEPEIKGGTKSFI